MKLLLLLRSRLLTLAMAGFCFFEICSTTGCVVYPTPYGEEVAGPVSVNANYGRPAGFYYRNYPVYYYGGRRCYYYGGRRYWYREGRRYYYRRGYRYYY
ncbi:MAG: hypothetical protein ABIP97_10210 [Chthoniobacterales bacterium]